MKQLIRKVASKFGLGSGGGSRQDSKDSRVVSLQPSGRSKGNVLVAYILEPFLLKPGEPISSAHTHDWESFQIVQTFLELGYSVDVISFRNKHFNPRKHYSIFVSARTNFDRISTRLNKDCLRIVHQDTAHWLFNNQAALTRLLDVQRRRGVTLDSVRIVENNWAIENAHCMTVLGNQFTIDTFRYAKKDIYRVPISVPEMYPWPERKNFDACRKKFLWFGSGGFVHKGLDLVIEAFSQMPDFHLTICGPIGEEGRFKEAYYKELYETPNIHTHGWVDVASDEFLRIASNCIALIYPSCSEGGGGSVITCMHAGLIPIVSYESSVDVGDFGVILKESTIDVIREEAMRISQQSVDQCKDRAKRTWEFARRHHTREIYASAYKDTVEKILSIYSTVV